MNNVSTRGQNHKPPLKRIAVFGANGRIGKPVARYIAEHSPQTGLTLIIRKEDHRETLQAEFPDASIVIADYYDLPSLERALEGVNGLFIVTPNHLDEKRAMNNLIYAVNRYNLHIHHIVRLLGDPPGMTIDRVPDVLRNNPSGTAIQHMIAKQVLVEARLPITYINVAAYFMQNFAGSLFRRGLRQHRTLVCPRNRRMAFIDNDDIGACSAAVLLSDDHRHIGATYHLDNGHDVWYFDEVAEIMAEAFGEPIAFDGSDEAFLNLKYNRDMNKPLDKMPDKRDYFIDFSQFEQDNQTIWRKTDIVEFLTGREPVKLMDWLRDNKEVIFREPLRPQAL